MELKYIRNFCIISHVDHGKSTLADRLLEITKTVPLEKMKPQLLDKMPLERERGITIKLQPATMRYSFENKEYLLNLIDTPGHVDFSYEVSRSLVAVEGALLLVDASQGIQAQTLANLHLAQEKGLKIIPVINKIDLPNLELDPIKQEISSLLKINQEEIFCISAKKKIGIEEVLEAIITQVPSPDHNKHYLKDKDQDKFRALIFDSYFDEYRGVVAYMRIFNGKIKAEDRIELVGTQAKTEVLETGIFTPDLNKQEQLTAGQIGYLVTGFKDIQKCRVGDTLIKAGESTLALSGYHEPQPMVFAGLYLKEGDRKHLLRHALEKLKLNDASLSFEPEQTDSLGFGFRAGFLGLLHLDIIQERLKREYNLDLVITSPSVAYQVGLDNGQVEIIYSATQFPSPERIKKVEEPWVEAEIVVPEKYVGAVMELVKQYRAEFDKMEYLDQEQTNNRQALLHYQLPLSLLLVDFYDKLKSVSSGYASYSYRLIGYRPAKVVKMDILAAGEQVSQLAAIVYQDWAYQSGRKIVKALKEVLPRQQFEIKLQAAIGSKIIASERIPPLRKDVTAKLYGGDVSRKQKLLKKQKKGKKRMMKFAKVNIPPEAYLAVMKK